MLTPLDLLFLSAKLLPQQPVTPWGRSPSKIFEIKWYLCFIGYLNYTPIMCNIVKCIFLPRYLLDRRFFRSCFCFDFWLDLFLRALWAGETREGIALRPSPREFGRRPTTSVGDIKSLDFEYEWNFKLFGRFMLLW